MVSSWLRTLDAYEPGAWPLDPRFQSLNDRACRVYQRLRVVLSYEPGAGLAGPMADKFGGLCNQIYSHVSILSVALYSGCEVVRATPFTMERLSFVTLLIFEGVGVLHHDQIPSAGPVTAVRLSRDAAIGM